MVGLRLNLFRYITKTLTLIWEPGKKYMYNDMAHIPIAIIYKNNSNDDHRYTSCNNDTH